MQPDLAKDRRPLPMYITETHEIDKFQFTLDRYLSTSTIIELIEKLELLFLYGKPAEPFVRHRFQPKWGLKDNQLSIELPDKVKKFRFLGGLHFVLGFDNDVYNLENYPSRSLRALYPPQLSRGLGSMYVYCNVCSATRVGDSFVPLLRQIVLRPAPNDEYRGMIEIITLDSPMYVPVKLSTINNIEIEIRTNIGDYFLFLEGSVTTLTLHFKRYE